MVTTYTLVLAIGDAGLRALAETRSRVVIARSAGSAAPNTTWLAWTPRRGTVVRWDETYGVYAAEVAVTNGAALRILDSVYPAADRRIYPFLGAAFGAPSAAPRVPAHHYDVHNTAREALTFGLFQEATIDGTVCRSAVNAVVLPPDFTADFATVAKLYIWTQPAGAAEDFAPDIPDNTAIVALNPRHPAMAYRFDDERATFVPETAKGTT